MSSKFESKFIGREILVTREYHKGFVWYKFGTVAFAFRRSIKPSRNCSRHLLSHVHGATATQKCLGGLTAGDFCTSTTVLLDFRG